MTFIHSGALLTLRKISSFSRKFLCICAGEFHMDRKNEKSKMELDNIPPIVSIYRHALLTFDDKSKKNLASNLNKLREMVNSLRAWDLGFAKTGEILRKDIWKKPSKAPCTYIEVFQNKLINMSVFVLKPGFVMPLHDHPHMHGLLKVISGAVRIRSFTEFPLTEKVNTLDAATRAKIEAARLAQGKVKQRTLFAEVSSDRVCKDDSPTCALTPTLSNYHEIQALDLPAAFFDILSPPYDTLIEGVGPRRCRYYQVINEISTNVVQLQETEVPECFYCDQAPYLGPQLG